MLVTERVFNNPHICGIQLDVSATEFAAGNFDTQPFYNTNITQGDFQEVYYSRGSASFSESSSESDSGMLYTQKINLKFPSNDRLRSRRIEELRRAKFISIKFSTDNKIILGRNDFFQNTRPQVKVRTNEKVTNVEFTTQSVFPVGFFENTQPFGFAYELPISFLEPL